MLHVIEGFDSIYACLILEKQIKGIKSCEVIT